MQLGDSGFKQYEMMNFANDMFGYYFGEDVIFRRSDLSNNAMGWFKLEYFYKPKSYKIIFEHDRLFFTIRIFDIENWQTSLPEIIEDEKINTTLEKENIKHAINHLVEILRRDNICFHKSIDNKLYKKTGDKITRVKHPFSTIH